MLAKKPKGTVQKRKGSGVTGLLWMFVGAILTVMCLGVLYLWNPFDIGSEVTTEERIVEPKQKSTDTKDFEFYDLLPNQEIMGVPDEDIISRTSEPTATGEPDVIVIEKKEKKRTDTDAANFGISESTILNPENTSGAPAARGEQEIVIIEDEGTYDEPSEPSNNRRNNDNLEDNNTSNDASGSTLNSAGQANRNNATPAATAKPTTNRSSYILQINSFSSAEQADKRRAQVLLAGVEARVVKSKQANGKMFYQVVTPSLKNRQEVLVTQQKLQNSGIDSMVVEQRY